MYVDLPVKYTLFLLDCIETWVFSTDFRKVSNFMKIRSVEADLFYTDGRTEGRTDMTMLTVGVRNFANAPKTDIILVLVVSIVILRI